MAESGYSPEMQALFLDLREIITRYLDAEDGNVPVGLQTDLALLDVTAMLGEHLAIQIALMDESHRDKTMAMFIAQVPEAVRRARAEMTLGGRTIQ